MSVHQFRPRAASAPAQPPETYRDRPEYSDFATALEDAERCAEDVIGQLNTALIADPADVEFVAKRTLALIRAALDVLEQPIHSGGAR